MATGGPSWVDALRAGARHGLLIGKSALAATIAWVLADVVLAALSATFAPPSFSMT